MLSSTARAFDGKREGLNLEFGIGAGWVPAKNEWVGQVSSGEAFQTTFAGWTRFRLGWGLSDHVMIQYVNDVGLTHTSRGLWLTGPTGVGGTYFFHSHAPSAFVEAGLGYANTSSGWGSTEKGGPAVWGGGGFEPGQGWPLRLTIGWDDVGGKGTTRFGEALPNEQLAVGLTISRLWY
ncbi:MAG: hypothetical protein ACM3JJ_00630 [Hyphomicrobiales bacterium]